MVGDSAVDVAAAKGTGRSVIEVAWGNARQMLAGQVAALGAALVAERFGEAPAMVQALVGDGHRQPSRLPSNVVRQDHGLT